MSWFSDIFGSKTKSVNTDPFKSQRGQAINALMGQWLTPQGTPQIPGFMQGPASTIGPLVKNLTQSMETGLPTNVSALAEASRTKAMRGLNEDILPQLLEKMSVGGSRFGTAATDAISKTTGDVLSNLAVNETQLGFNASEEAAKRKMLAMSMAGLPIELQKALYNIPELLQFILGGSPNAVVQQPGAFGQMTSAISNLFGGGSKGDVAGSAQSPWQAMGRW